MQDEKFNMLRNRLVKVYRHLGKQAKRLGVSCYRIYDHDLPEFPLCIEKYDDKLYVAEYKRNHGMTEEEHDDWMQHCLDVLQDVLGVSPGNIYLKLRQRKPGRLGQYQRLDDKKNEFVVEENGLKFKINLNDFLDTGLFLDHRVTRQLVRDRCRDKKVLNLFAYTGSFSVYAAAGGAAEVTTVDLSNTYLTWARHNLQLNGFDDPGKYRFIQADVKPFLSDVPAGYYDIIIMDPPTFSNSKRMKDILDIQRDHVPLINGCLRGMKTGGLLYFSTNYTKFQLDTPAIHSKDIKDITKLTTPFDFEKKLKRWCYLVEKN